MSLIYKLIQEEISHILSEDKRDSLKKMGLPPIFIDYFHNFYPPQSYKFSDWIVKNILNNQLGQSTTSLSLSGLLKTIIEDSKTEPENIESNFHFFKRKMEKDGLAEEFRNILKWANEKSGIDLNNFSLEDIRNKIGHEKEAIDNEATGEVMLTFSDGFYWINLNKSICDFESQKMGHCGKDARGSIWSLRDKNKQPHITATVDEQGRIHQVKGKENKKPVAKYNKYLAELLASPKITDILTGEDEFDFHLADLGMNGMKWVFEKTQNSALKEKIQGEMAVYEQNKVVRAHFFYINEYVLKIEDLKLTNYGTERIVVKGLFIMSDEEAVSFDEDLNYRNQIVGSLNQALDKLYKELNVWDKQFDIEEDQASHNTNTGNIEYPFRLDIHI